MNLIYICSLFEPSFSLALVSHDEGVQVPAAPAGAFSVKSSHWKAADNAGGKFVFYTKLKSCFAPDDGHFLSTH